MPHQHPHFRFKVGINFSHAIALLSALSSCRDTNFFDILVPRLLDIRSAEEKAQDKPATLPFEERLKFGVAFEYAGYHPTGYPVMHGDDLCSPPKRSKNGSRR
jgi:hypothetical protein